MAIIRGNTGDWEYVIGLEVHAQVTSNAKLFSDAPTSFGAEPNMQVDLVDAAMPGMLPVINEVCVKQAIKTGLGLNASVNEVSNFDRKNYFYPDLPQGYQISQFYHPIVSGGELTITLESGELKKLRIHHIHLEQDAGKSMHDQSPNSSFIDLNRAGIALMEIVSEADMRSPYEAAEYVKKLRSILRYLGTCDGDMEKGSMRCDANVSVRRNGEVYGTRCEIKNVNSIRNIVRAIEYEAYRQVEILEAGGKIIQETRLFDANIGETRSMRSKEEAHDYRYFPDPDLPPLYINQEYIAAIAVEIPELPDVKTKRYINDLNLSAYDADVLVADKDTADYFELVLDEVGARSDAAKAKIVVNWITGELFSYLNANNIALNHLKFTFKHFASLLQLIFNETISGKIAKTVFEIMCENGKNPQQIIEEEGLVQISDESVIQKVIDKVMSENQDSVIAYGEGKVKLFGFFVGQVMKEMGGKANPSILNELLKKSL